MKNWAVLALALALRLYGSADGFIVGDEYMQFFAALHPAGLREFLEGIRSNPHHMLLDPLSTYLAAKLGDSPFVLRLPSLLWGLAGVWAALRLSFMAGLLLAVSPMHVDWSRRADFYALSAALALLQTQALGGRWYAAWTAAHFLAHPYSALVTAGHAWLAKDRRRWLRDVALAAACALPWWLYSSKGIVARQGFWGEPPLGRFLLELPSHLAARTELAEGGAWLGLVFLACWARSRRWAPLAGLAAVVALDWWFEMYLAPRQLIWVLPFFLAGVAEGAGKWAPALALASLLYCVGSTRQDRALAAGRDRVVGELRAQAKPGDTFAFEDSLLAHSFLYHWDREAFRRVEGFRSFVEPVSAGGVTVLVNEPAPEGAWRFEGRLDELTVRKPALLAR